mgnify:CR=1 FL=1
MKCEDAMSFAGNVTSLLKDYENPEVSGTNYPAIAFSSSGDDKALTEYDVTTKMFTLSSENFADC